MQKELFAYHCDLFQLMISFSLNMLYCTNRKLIKAKSVWLYSIYIVCTVGLFPLLVTTIFLGVPPYQPEQYSFLKHLIRSGH